MDLPQEWGILLVQSIQILYQSNTYRIRWGNLPKKLLSLAERSFTAKVKRYSKITFGKSCNIALLPFPSPFLIYQAVAFTQKPTIS